MKTKTQVVSFIGGPGVGKSTSAAGVYYYLKRHGVSCELVREVAKEYYYRGLLPGDYQEEVSTEQWARVSSLLGKVDYIVQDTSLLLGDIYHRYSYVQRWEVFLNPINILLNRGTLPYDTDYRMSTEEAAKNNDILVKEYLDSHKIKYYMYNRLQERRIVTDLLGGCLGGIVKRRGEK